MHGFKFFRYFSPWLRIAAYSFLLNKNEKKQTFLEPIFTIILIGYRSLWHTRLNFFALKLITILIDDFKYRRVFKL